MSIKKYFIVSGFLFLLIAAVAVSALVITSEAKLSDDRISELRSDYPVNQKKSQELYDYNAQAPIDMTIKALANTFVVADVVEKLPNRTFSVSPESGSAMAAILRKQDKATLDVEYVEYQVIIRDIFYQGDSGVKFNPELEIEIDDTITISNQTYLHDDSANLIVGEKYVIPLMIRAENGYGSDYLYVPNDLYYVVDDYYVLSSSEAAEDSVKFDGLQLKKFKAAVIDIRDTPSKWDILPSE